MTRGTCLWVLVLSLGAEFAAFGPQVGAADPVPSEVDYLRQKLGRTEKALARTSSQLELLRHQLIEKTLEIKAEIKEGERVKAEQQLERAEELERQHRYEQGVRDWAVANFDNTRYARLPEMEIGQRLKQLQKAKLLATRSLLEFADESRLAVVSGRALNVFLELCGKAAVNHQQYREQFARLEELGHAVGGQRIFERSHIEYLRLKKGPRHSTMGIDVKHGALTLDWPWVIHNHERYREHTAAIDEARELAWEDLQSGRRIDPAVQNQMYQAADEICAEFAQDYEDFRAVVKAGKGNGAMLRQYLIAKDFVGQLRLDIVQFLQSRSLDDVTSNDLVDQLFPPGQPERPVAVEELMAAMVLKGYRFDAAIGSSGEQVHKMLYDQLVDYYLDLQRVQVTMGEQDWENPAKINQMRHDAQLTLRSSQWDPVPDALAMLRARPPENLLEYALMFAQTMTSLGRSVQPAAAAPAAPPPRPEPEPKWMAYEVGDRVSNKGFKIWWRGTVIELTGSRYRVELFYVNPAFRQKWELGRIYEFSDGQMKRL
jgi:hypothetical protein